MKCYFSRPLGSQTRARPGIRRPDRDLHGRHVERARRSLERRLREAHIGRFKPLADFDWSWPKECDRTAIEELMSLQFMTDASSVVLFGPNGVGNSMIAANIGHQAVHQRRLRRPGGGERFGSPCPRLCSI